MRIGQVVSNKVNVLLWVKFGDYNCQYKTKSG